MKKTAPEPEILQPVKVKQELRGAWFTRFDFAHENPDSMKYKIINGMKDLADANFNAVFFQLRGQCETFYPSPYEPWSKLINFTNPGFDPAKLAIEEAHKNGLKFYAYINLLPVWNEIEAPKDSTHIYHKHNPEVKDGWTLFTDNDSMKSSTKYTYFNPAHPEVHMYLKKIVRHLVENYNIDGLHFDRIRYPGEAYIDDLYSKTQFAKDSINSPITKPDWARKQLTDLVEDIVVEAMLIKPYLVNSAATWGLYRTDDLAGYEHFGSGYARYYQDAIDWLEKGIMDFIVPMTYWDMSNPLPNFNDLWLDFTKRTPNFKSIYPGLRIYDCDWIESGETTDQINFVRQNGGKGTVMFSMAALNEQKFKTIKDSIYSEKVIIPENMKRVKPGNVVQLNIKNLMTEDNHEVKLLSQMKRVDGNGEISFLMKNKPDTLRLQVGENKISISTEEWKIPYQYLVNTDGTSIREIPWVEMRKIPADITHSDKYPVLCKTDSSAESFINNKNVKTYKTGIFFDDVKFAEGLNRITAKAEFGDGSIALYETEVNYQPKAETKREPLPLWIDEKSFQPAADMTILPKDQIKISFKGSKGQTAEIKINGIHKNLKCQRRDFKDYSLYETMLPLRLVKTNKPVNLTVILKSDKKTVKFIPDLQIETKHIDEFPYVTTTSDNSILTYETGSVRLGGPIRTEFPKEILLKTSGKIGQNYRVHLNEIAQGFISEEDVEITDRIVKPEYFITSLYTTTTDSGEFVRIPYYENLPYTVVPEPHLKRIVINLYGAKSSATWLTHRGERKIIDNITWDHTTPKTFTVFVNLTTSKIWGYEVKKNGSNLYLHINNPPIIEPEVEKPLKGLTIAIEAGHGGKSYGAVGLSGLKEKDINLSLSLMLGKICKAKGAKIVQVRPVDKGMFLGEKRNIAKDSDANILVSIHANAGGSGYLSVDGTSTYWHNPFWAPFAEVVYDKLLDLDLGKFGVIGSFNYKVTRMSEIPAILVEQAFMSHAEDEEKLADPEFRQQMAEKIYEGIVEYMVYMNEK